jgi:SAM-dependent methyltransferase
VRPAAEKCCGQQRNMKATDNNFQAHSEELLRATCRLKSIIAIADGLGVKSGPAQRILDFGCGGGFHTVELRRMGMLAYGCDVSDRWDYSSAVCQLYAGRVSSPSRNSIPTISLIPTLTLISFSSTTFLSMSSIMRAP